MIPNGIDLTRFDPAAVPPVAVTALRTQLGLGSGPILTIVGQVTPWKGQADAIDIARLLRHHQPNAQLMIVGRAVFDSPASRFDNLAYELKLLGMARALPDGAIVFAGERDDIPTVLAASDVLLVPSWMEPFGRVVVEGMAMGLPVFATRGGGPSEIITDGIDGVLLPLSRPDIWASRIRALLADEAARAEMCIAARRRSAYFALGVHVQAVVTVLERAAATRRSDPSSGRTANRMLTGHRAKRRVRSGKRPPDARPRA